MEKENKNYKIFIWTTIILGIVLRIVFYSYDRPFWNDECALALNLVDFKIVNCFKTLSFNQAAPPVFLLLSGFFQRIIPDSELALRLFPLLSSVGSIFVFKALCEKLLNKKGSIIFAMILFCLNYELIYYAQEFKQYSSDILVFLGILTSYFYLNIKISGAKKLLVIGALYAGSLWLSFSASFAILTVLGLLALKNHNDYKKLLILFAPVMISFLCFYLNQKHLAGSTFLHDYWAQGFINQNFGDLFSVLQNYFIFSFNNSILFVLFFVGLILLIKNIKNEKSLMLLISLLISVLLAYFSIYPLLTRVALYLIPVFILISVQLLDYINLKNEKLKRFVCFMLIFLGSFSAVVKDIDAVLCKNFDYEDIVSFLNLAGQEMKDKDILYIPSGSGISYAFYEKSYNFKNVIIEKERIKDAKKYSDLLNNLPKNKTYYYVFSHFPDKKQRLEDIYSITKNKKNFKMYTDKSLNALIIFSL